MTRRNRPSNLIVRSPSLFRLGEYRPALPASSSGVPSNPTVSAAACFAGIWCIAFLPCGPRVRNTDPDLSTPWPFASDTCCRHESTSWRGNREQHPCSNWPSAQKVLGFNSIWVGDSLLARPRHEPLTLLAAVATRIGSVEIGTAVLLPALRNPVLLAHQVATLDQIAEGRLILGVGIAADVPNIRAEFTAAGVPFEKRVGRLLEVCGLRVRSGAASPSIGMGGGKLEHGVLGPTPCRAGGPPIWIGGSLPASLERAGRYFDGWLPIAPDAETWGKQWKEVQGIARAAGRIPMPSRVPCI